MASTQMLAGAQGTHAKQAVGASARSPALFGRVASKPLPAFQGFKAAPQSQEVGWAVGGGWG